MDPATFRLAFAADRTARLRVRLQSMPPPSEVRHSAA
jgi:hypothetical protein